MNPSEAHSDTALPFPAIGLIGKVLSDRYRIEALLGEGGMGAVYLGEHVLMRKRVAVKVLHAEMTRMPEIVARFEREAMAAAHIEHPNVAAATDFGKLGDGTFFLVLEYVEGVSLRDVVASAPLAVDRVLHIGQQVASALGRAHGLGIVHRDLKPENVMLVDRDGDTNFVKVLDFGIAKVPMGESFASPGSGAGQVLTQLGMVYGTPEYMAPEQALGQTVDARADLYALGVLMFEMLTGVRPFEAASKVALLGAKVTSDPPRLIDKNPTVDAGPAVEELVRGLLEKDATERYQTAQDVVQAIEACRFGVAATQPPPGAERVPSLVGSARYRVPLASSAAAAVDPLVPPSAIARKIDAGARLVRAWQARLPARLRGFPNVLWVAAGGLTTMMFLLVAISAFRAGPAHDTAPDASGSVPEPTLLHRFLPPPTAPAETLAAAVTEGASALEDLASQYPEDPAVWRALVRLANKDKRGADAMRALTKLTALQPTAIDEDDMRDAFAAAVAGAPDVANAAFVLLDSGLGNKGPEVAFELLTQKGTSSRNVQRLKQWLAKPEVKARTSSSLAIAIDFRNANSCDAKKALLSRVKEQADARLLPTLRGMQVNKGCGFLGLADCWGCMRRDGALAAAEAAVAERASK